MNARRASALVIFHLAGAGASKAAWTIVCDIPSRAGARGLVRTAAALALAAGCSGTAAPTQRSLLPATASPAASAAQTPSPSTYGVALTDSGCATDPAGGVSSRTLRFRVRNESSTGPANFEVVRLSGTFEEADQFLAEARAATSPPAELPFIADEVDRSGPVDSGRTADVGAVSLSAGSYAVLCIALDEHEDIITAYVVGPYTVLE